MIVCPEAGRAARVNVDTRHATATAALGRLHLRVASCTLWPARSGRKQGCLEAAAFEA